MNLPALLPVPIILERLQLIFPVGIEQRGVLVREMAAKTIWVFLYGGMIEGTQRLLRPSHIYLYTEDQANRTSEAERMDWVASSKKQGFRPAGKRWYADTTREPIRDETLRYGLVDIGAVGRIVGIPTTSSLPIYYLNKDFAELFDPGLEEENFYLKVAGWQAKHLSVPARLRMAMIAGGKVAKSDEVAVACPNGSVLKLAPGPSSLISKDVVEKFSQLFLKTPALLWLSESGAKVNHFDEKVAKAIGLNIDAAKTLPDIILVNIGAGSDTSLIFIEVVATDGPMTRVRKEALLTYVRESKFPENQCYFGTAFEDRAHQAARKAMPTLGWGTFVWFRTEPEKLMWLSEESFDITSALPLI